MNEVSTERSNTFKQAIISIQKPIQNSDLDSSHLNSQVKKSGEWFNYLAELIVANVFTILGPESIIGRE